MEQKELIQDFKQYLLIERALSDNSIQAYIDDVYKLYQFREMFHPQLNIENFELEQLREFVSWIFDLGLNPRSQSRIISGIRAFFKFLHLENYIHADPSRLLELPKIGRKLPDVLSLEEVDELKDAIDLSKPEGHRNRAIIECLYSCGIRVSELINLRLTNLYLDEGFIRVEGKGKKERLVPISQLAIREIQNYYPDRNMLNIDSDSENILFLNRRGKQLTRVMIFTIIKRLAEKIGLNKEISPHSFRHSFATHMVEKGADLRSVQELLGHESILTTEIYTHLNQNILRETIEQFHPRAILDSEN